MKIRAGIDLRWKFERVSGRFYGVTSEYMRIPIN
jgi:hypothetical protein